MTPAALDALLAQYDRRWGPCRLPDLVSPETRARYEAVRDALAEGVAPWADSPAAIRQVMAKAWAAMEAEAIAAGHAPLPPAIVEVQGERARYAFAFDDAHRQALVLRYAAEARPVTIWSASDLLALVDRPELPQEAMRQFPGASVQPAPRGGPRRKRPELDDGLDDILPMPEDAA